MPGFRQALLLALIGLIAVLVGAGLLVDAGPTRADEPPGWAEIDVGVNHTCGITTADGLRCWGLNSSGQLGTGDFLNSALPQNVVALGLGGTQQVSAGGAHTCAVAASRVRCWGDNLWGQLGNGEFGPAAANPLPLLVSDTLFVAQVSAGHDHTCAVTTESEVWCWGLNNYGQVGNNTSGNAWLGPTPVCETGTGFDCTGGQRLSGVLEVEAGGLHTCALMFDGAVKCWGMNYNGQLGIGDSPDEVPTTAECTSGTSIGCRALPVNVILPFPALELAVGGAETCVVDLINDAYCWGYNAHGQVGCNGSELVDPQCWPADPGDPHQPSDPYAVPSPEFVDEFLDETIRQITTSDSSCALDGLDGVWCWGLNNLGAVGNGEIGARETTPQPVVGLGSGVESIAGGGTHNCAILLNGSAKCWGYNHFGQLGNGLTTPEFVGVNAPVDVVTPDVGLLEVRFSRCPEIGSAPCPIAAPTGQFISTDDAAIVVMSFQAELNDVFRITFTRPNYPDDGNTVELPACTIAVLLENDVPTALRNCDYAGNPEEFEEIDTFPGGCPCVFDGLVSLPIDGTNWTSDDVDPVPSLGAAFAGEWQVEVQELSGRSVTLPFTIQRVPAVLLVHGYGSSCQQGMYAVEPWLEQHLVDFAVFPGAEAEVAERVECFDPPGGNPSPGANDRGYDWKLGTLAISAQMEAYVEATGGFLERVSPVPDDKIDIIAHSYGGVNSRYYIEKRGGSQYVDQLIMLGTPNLGTIASDFAMIGDLGACAFGGPIPLLSVACLVDLLDGDWQDDLGARDMSLVSPIYPQINPGWTASDTEYHVLAGEVSLGASLPGSGMTLIIPGPDDCLVSSASAAGPFPPATTLVYQEVSHKAKCFAVPGVADDPPLTNCQADFVHTFCQINQFLEIPVEAGVSAGSIGSLSAQGATGDAVNDAVSIAAVGDESGVADLYVNATQSTTDVHQVYVEASATSVVLSLIWEDGDLAPDFQISVRRPDNSLVLDADAGVSHDAASPYMEGQLADVWAIQAPAAGYWTLEVTPVSPLPEPGEFMLLTAMESAIVLSADASPNTVDAGQTVQLTADLSVVPGLDATVSVGAVTSGAAPMAVDLLDDGASPDESAADGVFAAQMTFLDCGPWIVSFTAIGSSNTEHFERATSVIVDVCPDADGDGFDDDAEDALGSDPLDAESTPEGASVAGSCSDGLDNDGDGLTDGADPGCAATPTPTSSATPSPTDTVLADTATVTNTPTITNTPTPTPTPSGNTFVVNSTADRVDATPGNGVCADSLGECTLRAAVMEANQKPAGTAVTIVVPANANAYVLTLGPDDPFNNEFLPAQGDLDFSGNKTWTIVGDGPDQTIVDGGGFRRILSFLSGALVRGMTLRNAGSQGVAAQSPLTLEDVVVTGNGAVPTDLAGNAGVLNSGLLIVRDSRIENNGGNGVSLFGLPGAVMPGLEMYDSVVSGNGANGINIVPNKMALIVRSTISDNGTSTDGGGIYNRGVLTMTDSTVSGNRAGARGGGLANYRDATITNSTFSGNRAGMDGGGIFNDYTGLAALTITDSTFAANLADADGNGTGDGGGVANGPGGVGQSSIARTLIDENADAGGEAPDCAGAFSGAMNLIGNAGGCGLLPGNLTGVNSGLFALADNGGPTQTHGLPPGSPAIDAAGNGCLAADQRGVTRPQGPACDVGAFEHDVPPADAGPPVPPAPGVPVTFVVNDTTDLPDAALNGVCAGATGTCTLRAAVMESNSVAGPNVILLGEGTYAITRPTTEGFFNFNVDESVGDFDIMGPTLIRGLGRELSIIDGGGLSHVFGVEAPPPRMRAPFELSGLTVRNGARPPGSPSTTPPNGGIQVQVTGATLSLDNVLVTANSGPGVAASTLIVRDSEISFNTEHGVQSAIFLGETVSIIDSLLSNNMQSGLSLSGFEVGAAVVRSTVQGNANTGVVGPAIGRLDIQDSTIAGNQAPAIAGSGGGVFSNGTTRITGSTIIGNSSPGQGGGVANGGPMTIVDTTISGNTATTDGGGIHASSTLEIINSTVSGNDAGRHGGGIHGAAFPQARLINVTVADNSADSDANGTGDGGGIFQFSNLTQLKNSIVAGNTDTGGEAPDCAVQFGSLSSEGYNLVGDMTGCEMDGETSLDVTGQPPMLGPLADNGGDTFTHALLAGSPAIDAATNGGCPPADQRGVTRPQGAACDIGAFELEGVAPPATPTPSPTGTATASPTATETPVATATDTPAATVTSTSVPTGTPTPTPTNTAEPTATNTAGPTSTGTPPPTATNTAQATDTPESTSTHTPVPTATDTPQPTATHTPESTATPTSMASATSTPVPTATDTPEPTATTPPPATSTASPSPTATSTAVATGTSTPSSTRTPAVIHTASPGATAHVTRTVSPTRTVVATRTVMTTRTVGATRTVVTTRTAAPSRTATASPTHGKRPKPCADVTGDGRVTLGDVVRIAKAIASQSRNGTYDVDRNGKVGYGDLVLAMRQLGRRCHAHR
ncbi:MAG: choice-of-anchor Q domain-containing protein [Dehalococcoidia bacterium]